MSSRWVDWFSAEDSSIADAEYGKALTRAHDCLAVAVTPWFTEYLSRLEDLSNRPGKIGDHADMIASVSRANTYKEIRSNLLDEIAKARAFIAAAKER